MTTQIVEAIFQDGAFRPTRPVSSAIVEGQHVRLVVEIEAALDILALAAAVYEGLSEAEIAEVEQIALDRSDFFLKARMTRAQALLDTDILSAIMRAEPAAVAHARDYVAVYPQLTISIITRYEIRRGLKAKRATAQLKKFEILCASLQVLAATFLCLGLCGEG